MRYSSTVRVYDDHPPVTVELPETLEEYRQLWETIEAAQRRQEYDTWVALMRLWSAADHYFLLLFVLTAGRNAWNAYRHEPHFKHPSHLAFARKIQFADLDDQVVIGAREWGKSTHLDCDDIRDKLLDANHASIIFSLTGKLAEKHLAVIKKELEENELLLTTWPDRFWLKDERPNSVPWGLHQGLCIKRSTSRPEQSFEAHPFERSLPTGMHPDKRRYDDIEADATVESELKSETIEERWVSSQDLKSSSRTTRRRVMAGTYYSAAGLMMKLQTVYGCTPILLPGEDLSVRPPEGEAGPFGGLPSNGFTRTQLWTILKDKGGAELVDGKWRRRSNTRADRYYGRQIVCDALAGEISRMPTARIQRYDEDPLEVAAGKTIVVCGDCSGGGGDPTFLWVWGLAADKTFWWLDAECQVVVPSARKRLIYEVCRRWSDWGDLQQLRLEQFGAAEYVEAQEEYFEAQKFSLPMPILKCNDNRQEKMERAFDRWQPPMQDAKVFFPRRLLRDDERGNAIDLVSYMLDKELGLFPTPPSDHGLDAGGLIWETEERAGPLPWPVRRRRREAAEPAHADYLAGGTL